MNYRILISKICIYIGLRIFHVILFIEENIYIYMYIYAGKESIMQECTTTSHMENGKQTSRTNSFEIENLLKTAEQVTGICRSPGETRKSSPTGSVVSSHSQALTPSRQLSDAEKLKKVILELIETERTYVKVGEFC